jgi:DNA-binding GntR family transcriptional regulator
MTATATATAADRVAEYLRLQILGGQLAAGERVKERDLAQVLGVSRGPTREALRLLEREGLLEIRPYAGARVVRFDKTEMAEIVTLRRQVEYFSIGNAALISDPKLVADLKHLAAQMREAHGAREAMRLIDLDLKFHLRICEASGHSTLIAVMRTLLPRLSILWYPQVFKGHTPETFEESHLKMVRAIENRDLAEAIRATDQHIENFTFDLDLRLTKMPSSALAN